MIDVLGLPLAQATQLLASLDCPFVTTEVRSRKGTGGGDARVLRQRMGEDGTVELTYACCETQPKSYSI